MSKINEILEGFKGLQESELVAVQEENAKDKLYGYAEDNELEELTIREIIAYLPNRDLDKIAKANDFNNGDELFDYMEQNDEWKSMLSVFTNWLSSDEAQEVIYALDLE